MSEFVLSGETFRRLEVERDRKVARLRLLADEMSKLSPYDFLRHHGLDINDTEDLELVGRLAKANWRSVEYSTSDGSWLAHSPGYEQKVSDEEVMRVLGTFDYEGQQ